MYRQLGGVCLREMRRGGRELIGETGCWRRLKSDPRPSFQGTHPKEVVPFSGQLGGE